MTSLLLKESHAETLIANALLEYTPAKLVLSFNGGKDCTVLLDLVCKVWKRFPKFSGMKLKTVYVAENDPFPELEKFISETVDRFPFMELYTFRIGLKDAFLQFSKENCLDDYAILIGIRRTDPFCERLEEVNPSDNGWPKFTRLSPLLNWNYSHIWQYIDFHRIKYCQLYNEGYTSLGSRSKTMPNPALKLNGEFLHARLLKDHNLERSGRFK